MPPGVPFREALRAADPLITFEVRSPAGWDVRPYVSELEALGIGDVVSAVNVTNNPMGMVRIDPLPYSYVIRRETGLDVIPHLKCWGETLAGIQRWLLGASSLGIGNVLVVRGDVSPGEEPPERFSVLKVISGIKRNLNLGSLFPNASDGGRLENPTDLCVGAALVPRRREEVGLTLRKLGAGVDFFQTQITYSPEDIVDFVREGRERGLSGEVPILVGVSPLPSVRLLEYIRSIPEVHIGRDVVRRLKGARDMGRESVEVCCEVFEGVVDSLAEQGMWQRVGLHIMPIRSPELGAEIALRVAGK